MELFVLKRIHTMIGGIHLRQIKYKLLFSYLVLSLNLLILGGLAFLYLFEANKLHKSENDVLSIRLQFQKLKDNDNNFLNKDRSRDGFFVSGKSIYIDRHNQYLESVRNKLATTHELHLAYNYKTAKDIAYVRNSLVQYDSLFHHIVDLLYKRGYKDYGIEGKMRSHAREFEDIELKKEKDILSLRRLENDFFIRKDLFYVNMFNTYSEKLLADLIELNGDTTAITHLKEYLKAFNEVVNIDKELGFTEHDGARQKFYLRALLIDERFSNIIILSGKATDNKLRQGAYSFIIIIVISILLSVLFSIYYSKLFSQPIVDLVAQMNDFNIQSASSNPFPENQSNGIEELQVLTSSCRTMAIQLKKQFDEIDEKTQLLESQNTQLNKINKELDQFIYSASHDLKAPLSSLLGLVNLLKMEINAPQYEHYFDMMNGSIRKLELHIADVITYAKNHQLNVRIEHIELRSMLEGIVDLLRFQKGAESITLSIELNQTLQLHSDAIRLNIILFNLLSNAYKYHNYDRGDKFISIRIKEKTKQIVIEIEDNGQGISNEHLDKIFQLFYRANNKAQGSGLGLYLVKEALDKLNGNISVRSVLGEGTCFTVELPNISTEVLEAELV